MGLRKKFSFSEYDRRNGFRSIGGFKDSSSIDSRNSPDSLPNPDSSNWKIVRSKQVNRYLVVEILYPDCVNYEGRKILVYEDVNINTLISQKYIDPHFSENKKWKSPIARFQPTESGWKMANLFTESIIKND
jgi:hypothetical protein